MGGPSDPNLLANFSATLRMRLVASAEDPNVAGFKSVVCYRTGLDVSAVPDPPAEAAALYAACERFLPNTNVPLRLADKPLNDLVVRMTLEVAAEYSKPGTNLPVFLLFGRSRATRLDYPFLIPPSTLQCSSIRVLATRISRLRVRVPPTCSR
jgi:hypothetical protein